MLLNLNLSTWARRMASSWFGLRGPKRPKRRVTGLGIAERLERREMLTAYTVTTLNDIVNPGDGVISLREALDSANSNAGADTIQFGSGLNGTVSLTNGELIITDSVTLTGNGSAHTTIDAQNNSRAFDLLTQAMDVTFTGLTITRGTDLGEGGGIRDGADHGSVLSLNDVVLSNNSVNGFGGGLFVFGYDTVNITNSKITGNRTTANGGTGGGIHGFNGGILTITNSEISGNETFGDDAGGGGMYWLANPITVTDSIISNNQTHGESSIGGAIYTKDSRLQISNSLLSSNGTSGVGSSGGAIYIGPFGELVVDAGSQFMSNSTTADESNGGAIYSSGGTVSITDSTLHGNIVAGESSSGGVVALGAGTLSIVRSELDANGAIGLADPFVTNPVSGGAVFMANGTVTIDSSSLVNNTTTGSGGGAYVRYGRLNVINSTISANSATTSNLSTGGGLAVYSAEVAMDSSTVAFNTAASGFSTGGVELLIGSAEIYNSIIAKNQGGNAPDLVAPTQTAFVSPLTVRNSLIGNNQGTGLGASANPNAQGNIVGTNAAPIDPRLNPLANNGGGTLTYSLQTNSPALNRGSNARADTLGLTTDQTGRNRVAGTAIDMGAYEVQGPTVASLVRSPAAQNPTSATSVSFIITFSESVSGVTAGQFTAVTTLTVVFGSINVSPVNGSTYIVTINGVSGAGLLGLQFDSNGTVTSTSTTVTMSPDADFTSTEVFTIQAAVIPLTVQSIAFAPGGISPTTATSVSFKVTFSAPVQNVTAGLFQIVKTGTVASGTPQLTGSGAEYTVTVSGITGQGSLGLNFQDNGTVTRISDGHAMTQPNFTGAVYQIIPGSQGTSDLDVDGLRFHIVGGTFTVAGALNSFNGPVQVGFVPSSGNAFTPLAEMSGTVSINTTTKTFAATGAVKAIISGNPLMLFANGLPETTITDLINGQLARANGASLTVAGVSFTLTSLQFTSSPQPTISLQGSLTLPKGITVSVKDSNFVSINSTGVKLNGASLSLTQTFNVGNVTFDASGLTASYSSTGDVFTLTGAAAVTVSDIANLSVNFTGNGLVITNGAFTSLDATVNGKFDVKGVKITATGLHLAYANDQFTMSGTAGVEIAGIDSSISVTFGSPSSPGGPSTPGIVITSGKLASLDMAVSGTVTVAKVAISTTDLRITYADSKFTLTGKAKATISGLGDLSVQFGDATHAGMVVDSGKLQRLDMGITANFVVKGVTIKAENLQFTYVAPVAGAPGTFSLSGSASVMISGMSGVSDAGIGVTFGHEAHPGLVVTDGQLQQLDVTINANFVVKGVTFNADNLEFTYVAGAGGGFSLTGTAKLMIAGMSGVGGAGIGVAFGYNGQPGIVITNDGTLQKLDITINANFAVKGVTFNVTDLRFTYLHDANNGDSFSLSGSASIMVDGMKGTGQDLGVAVKFGYTQPATDGQPAVVEPGIVINQGVLEKLDITIDAAFKVASVVIQAKGLRFTYTKSTQTFTVAGDAMVDTPGAGFGVRFGYTGSDGVQHAGLVIANGVLESIDVAVTVAFSIEVVKIELENVGFSWERANNRFSLSGGVKLIPLGLDGLSVEASFGDPDNPEVRGLVIENGDLVSLNFTFTRKIDVKAVSLEGKISLTYDNVHKEATLSGLIKVTAAMLGTADAKLGDSTKGTKGLVINKDGIKAFDLTVMANFSAAGLSATGNLAMHYDNTSAEFVVTGDANLTIPGVGSATAKFGDPVLGTKGLVINKDGVKSFNLTATANFSVAGVSVTGNLVMTYSKTSAEFIATGDGALTIPGVGSATAKLGDPSKGTQGLVINSDGVKTFDLTATANFGVAGVTVTGSLAMTYSKTSGEFTATGSAALKFAGIDNGNVNVSALLGDPSKGTKGLVINSSGVKSFDLTATGNFSLAGVTVNGTLALTYSKSSGEFSATGSASLKFAGIDNGNVSVTALLGDPAKGIKGLVITSSGIKSLDLAATGSFSLAGVSVNGTLALTYSKASGEFSATGSAALKFAGIDNAGVNVTGKLGDLAKGIKGLVINSSGIKSFDITATGSFSLAGVSVNGTLALTYSKASGEFSATGNASVTVAGIGGVTGLLGDSAQGTKGLVINSSGIKSFDITVTGNFSVSGVSVSGSLHMTYSKASGEFAATGNASLTLPGIGAVSAKLGDAGTQGLVINSNGIKSFDLTVTGSFSVAGVSVNGALKMTYSKALGEFTATGQAALTVAGIGNVTAKLGDPGTKGLVINSSGIKTLDMVVTGNFKVAGVSVSGNLMMTYSQSTREFVATGSVTLNIGGIGNVTATLGGTGTRGLVIKNGSLQSLDMRVNANFSVGPLALTGNLTMSYVNFGGFTLFSMSGTANGKFLGQSLFTVDMGTVQNPGMVIVNGALYALNITLRGDFAIQGVSLGGVQMTASYDAASQRFFFSGNARLTLPSSIPDWLASVLGGRNLGSIGVELNVVANKPGDSYLKATVGSYGFIQRFDGRLSLIGSNPAVSVVNSVLGFFGFRGPLDGATLYFDPNFNFDLAHDPFSVSGDDGRFENVVPVGASTGQLVVVGGVDRSTGLTNSLRLTAPYSASVVSPLTSLVNQLMQERGLSEGDAIVVVNSALGIPITIDLLQQTLALEAVGGDAVFARAFSREVAVGSVVQTICSLLSARPGAPTLAELSTQGFAAIAALLGETGGAPLQLSDPELILDLINRTAASAGLTIDTNIATSAAQVISGVMQRIDDLTLESTQSYLNQLLQIQTVTEGSIAPDLARLTSGAISPTSFVNNYTGDALTGRINAATFGPLNIVGPVVLITPLVAQAAGAEHPGTFDFQVTLSSPTPSNVPVTVHYATRGVTGTTANVDFAQTSGILTWQPGDVAPKTISIPVFATNSDLNNRTFAVDLSDVQNAELANDFGLGFIQSTYFTTTTAVSSSDTTADYGQELTFTAQFSYQDPAHTVPAEGTVTFFDGDEFLSMSDVEAGVALFSTTTLSAGVHHIRAVYSGALLSVEKYLPSESDDVTETVAQFGQTITFPSISDVMDDDAPIVLSAFTSSGLTISYRVVSGPANVNGEILTLVGPGTVVVEAGQDGDGNFTSATPISRTFAILDSGTGSSNTAPVAVSGTAHVNPGETINGQLVATDVDGDVLTFELTLDAEHGTVILNSDGSYEYTADADYEGFDSFSFFALDGVLASNISTLNIIIGDPNQPPVVDNATLTVSENSTASTVVGFATATDPNPGQSKTFSITNGNTDGAFAIEPATGKITVVNSAALDFENRSSYSLTIQVSDDGDPAETGEGTITINVTDVNEAPMVSPATFTISENSLAGSTIGTITATDVDAAQSRTFSIIDGNTNNAFSINPVTGLITVANSAALDFESKPTFTLTIQATDDGISPQSSTATVTVNLTNVPEQPVLTGGSGNVTYLKLQSPVKVMPNLTVQSGTGSGAPGSIVISVFVPKKGLLSDYSIGNSSSLGTVAISGQSDFRKSGGTQKITITLNEGVTDQQVQNFLRGISFSSKKMDPAKAPLGRKIEVQVFNLEGSGTPSNVITTHILAKKK
ncbi:MAG: hemagglutination domain protein [Planctomycetaceae bacterium]|nr:hemagglutination domain protein [Planctomycetaceae bacterium]